MLYDGGERVYLGIYDSAYDAAKAYDEKSVKRFGLTNSLNFRHEYKHLSKETA